jgi:C-terminal processing protease CtpA/Prc
VRKEFVEPKGKAGRVEPKKSAIRKRAPKDAEDKDDDEGDPDKQTSHDLPQVIGIGVAIESADGAVIVRQVLPDTPAGKDGRLKVGDEIVGIQNDNGEQVELKGKALPEVTRSLRGSEGQRLRLVVVPKDSSDRKVYELTRERLKLTAHPEFPKDLADPSADDDSKPGNRPGVELPPAID